MAKWLAYYDEESEMIKATRLYEGRYRYVCVGDDMDDAVRKLQEEMRCEAAYLRTEADSLNKAADRGRL